MKKLLLIIPLLLLFSASVEAAYYQKHKVGEDQNSIIRLASKISKNDINFILTLEAENGLWRTNRVSGRNRNGTRDYGLCQLNSRYHWNFIRSPEFKDPEMQLRYCHQIYKKRHGAFYGHFQRLKHKNKFFLTK